MSRAFAGVAVLLWALAAPAEAVLQRYYGNTTVGHVIDRGIYALLFGIALGTVSEISFHLRRLRRTGIET